MLINHMEDLQFLVIVYPILVTIDFFHQLSNLFALAALQVYIKSEIYILDSNLVC